MQLRKFLVPEFVFGNDSRKLAGQYAKNLGAKNVLIVTDAEVLRCGWVKDITDALDNKSIAYEIFSDVSPNPRDTQIMKGAQFYIQKNCNIIIAVGGGSVIDCAKGIGIVSSNHRHILEFEGVDMVPVPIPPLICIPTTSGSSADVSQFAIINNTTNRVKVAIISKSVVPDIALVDPVPLTSLNTHITAYTGIDALVHAVEAYVSSASSVFTDMHALKAIELIAGNLRECVRNPFDLEIRSKIMLGSLHAGLAFSNASLGCVHALAHSLGGSLDIPHGICNAALLPGVIEFNYNYAESRYKDIYDIVVKNRKTSVLSKIKSSLKQAASEFIQETGITFEQGAKGLGSEDIEILAKNALKDPCNATNPRRPSVKDFEILLKEVL